MKTVATAATLSCPGNPTLEAAVADNHEHRRDDHRDDEGEAHAHRGGVDFEDMKAPAFIGYHAFVFEVGLLLVRLRAAVLRSHRRH